MKKDTVNWNEEPLKKWLQTTTRKGTRATYKSAYRAYHQYTNTASTQLIDEAIQDARKDPRERKDVVKVRLLGFHNWLLTEFPVYSRGSEEKQPHQLVRKGVRPRTAHSFVGAIRSFYGAYDITIKLKGREKIPRGRVYNKRMDLTTLDVRALVNHAGSPRDRAIILTLFQGAMDVSTLCSLKFKDVARSLEKDEYPLKLDVSRPKTDVEYYTFLGRDAIESIKAYLHDLKGKGIKITYNTPLFLKSSNKALKMESMTENLVQNMMRDVAIKSGLVDEELNGADQNPAGPHALREAFSSILINHGVPDVITDFWQGHSVGEMGEAYKRGRFEELKQLYMEKEIFISISAPSENLKQLEERVRGQLDATKLELELQKSKTLGLYGEVESLRKNVQRLEGALRTALTSGKRFTEEAVEDLLIGRDRLAEQMEKKGLKKYVSEQ